MPKRFVATVLIFLLVLQSVPLTAFAAEDIVSTTPVVALESAVSSSIAVSTTSSVSETNAATTITTTTNTASSTAVNSEEVTDEEEDDEVVDTTNDSDLDLHKNLEGIVRQSESYTCGPAALATLLSQLGDDTTEHDVLSFAPASKTDGVSLFALKQATVQLGHSGILKKWTAEQLAEYLKTSEDPVLIHDIKQDVGGHFSVVRDIKDGTVSLSDTEAGNITYSFSDFSKVFTGYTLIVDPDIGSPTSSSNLLLSDTSTNVSDEEAITITGKYVPVAIAAANNGASVASNTFAQCMKAASLQPTTQLRRTQQSQCYQTLGAALSQTEFKTEAIIAAQAGPSITGFELEKNKDLQYTIDSDTFQKLTQEKDQAQTAVTTAQQKLQQAKETVAKTQATLEQAKTKQQQVLQANAVLQGKKTDYQNQLANKQSTLQALSSQISSAKLSLGSINASITAASSNLGSLSRTLQAKLTNTKSQITSKQSTLRSLQQEINQRQTTINNYNNQISNLQNTIAYKKSRRQSYSYEQNQLNNLTYYRQSEQSSLNRAQNTYNLTQNDITNLEQQLSSGSNQVAIEQAALNTLKQKQQLAEQDLQRKQVELPRIQNDITILVQALNKLPQPAPVPPVDYTTYNQAVTIQNQAQTVYNTAVTTYNQAVQAIQDEKNFIDSQEKVLDSKIEKDVVIRPAAAIANTAVNTAKTTANFGAGVVYQVVDNNTLGVKSATDKALGVDPNTIPNQAFQAGRAVGNSITIAQGTIEMGLGGATAQAGFSMAAAATPVCGGAVATTLAGAVPALAGALPSGGGTLALETGSAITAAGSCGAAALGTGAVAVGTAVGAHGASVVAAATQGNGAINGTENKIPQIDNKIKISPESLKHVTDSHLPGGNLSDGKSLFLKDENLANLIKKSENVTATKQANTNLARIVDAGRIIGIDRATGAQTRLYTVITDAANNLVTMFPGNP